MGRILKAADFAANLNSEHWGENWRDRKHVQTAAPDGSILEITRANEYIRIVALTHPPKKDTPFAIYWYTSLDYPERPKTEFYLDSEEPRYMNAAGISRVIQRIVKGKRKPWLMWIVTVSRKNARAAR